MRTTLTIDEDVGVQIERLRRQEHLSLRAVINQALRVGLREMSTKTPARREKFQTAAVSLGGCLLPSIDDITETLAVVEGDSFR